MVIDPMAPTVNMPLKTSPEVPTQVKDRGLVERRRRQIVDAAVRLFIDQGFHKTTTRQIARASGFSIGTLYEYVNSKEDVLYLVCTAIHAEVERGVQEVMNRAGGGREALQGVIREYFLVCHRMSDHILLMYQETKSLPPGWRDKVLENEVRITGLFHEAVAAHLSGKGQTAPGPAALELMAHNIAVLGHMWTFRRWHFRGRFDIEDYITHQTALILKELERTDV
jgi:TetR/AcrR family transcriptional regulator, cholesterol catabolism regulator